MKPTKHATFGFALSLAAAASVAAIGAPAVAQLAPGGGAASPIPSASPGLRAQRLSQMAPGGATPSPGPSAQLNPKD